MKKYIFLCIVLSTVFASGCTNMEKQCTTDSDCEMFGCDGCFTRFYSSENAGMNCSTRPDPLRCVCYKNECSDISKMFADKLATSNSVKMSIETCREFVDMLYEKSEDFGFSTTETLSQSKAFRLMRCYEVVCREAQKDDRAICSDIIVNELSKTCKAETVKDASLCDILIDEQYRNYCYGKIDFGV